MIRVVQRRLIIPRGDTGNFTLPLLPGAEQGDVAVFSIYDPLMQEVVLQKKVKAMDEDAITFNFAREDTINLEPSRRYEWDVRIYHNPRYEDDEEGDEYTIPVNGDTIDSYYSAYRLPICEITVAP